MPYKTVSIKLLPPTKTKQTILNDAIERYSAAFEIMLKEIQQNIQYEQFSKTALMKFMDKDFFSCVSHLNVEPFKDALKLDLAKLISIYVSSQALNKKAKFPVTRTEKKDIENYINNENNLSVKKIDDLFNKFEKKRPLLFCRFDSKRDYSIIKSNKDSYYAQLYLFNRKNAVDGKRFILFPLMISDWQNKFLSDMYAQKAIPKSAELIEKNKSYYLNVRFWYNEKEKLICNNYLGASRGINNNLFYAVSDKNGEILTSDGINAKNINGKNKLHILANQIISFALEHNCQIIMENFTKRSDGLKPDNLSDFINVGEYNQIIRLVSYKAGLLGLNEPVLVSANAIFYRCPNCGSFKKVNQFGNDKFICVTCGYSNELEYIGAVNLARTLLTYKKNKVPVNYHIIDNVIFFRLDVLNYEFSCNAGNYAINDFFADLQGYITKNFNSFTKSQQFTAKKILNKNGLSKIKFIETK